MPSFPSVISISCPTLLPVNFTFMTPPPPRSETHPGSSPIQLYRLLLSLGDVQVTVRHMQNTPTTWTMPVGGWCQNKNHAASVCKRQRLGFKRWESSFSQAAQLSQRGALILHSWLLMLLHQSCDAHPAATATADERRPVTVATFAANRKASFPFFLATLTRTHWRTVSCRRQQGTFLLLH